MNSEIRTKVELISVFKTKVSTNDFWAKRALLFLFDKQTESEQLNDSVEVNNGLGFRSDESKFLSSLAKQLINKGFLTQKQMIALKKAMPKYAGQLVKCSINSGKIRKENGKYIW